MAYSINSSSGNLLVTVPENTINTTATSLALVGRGATNYGAAVNTNLVHLTENFASSVQPAHPLLGQTWYDSANDRLSYYKPSGWVNVRIPEDYIMANIANIAGAVGAAGALSGVLGNVGAQITNLGDVFYDGNVAITYVLQDLRSTINNNQSFVTHLSNTFANANIAWANTLMSLGANITSGSVTTSAGISDFYEAVATATYSLATHVETLQANYNSLESNTTALISHVDSVFASANLAIAQQINTLLANVTTGNVTTSAGILDFSSAVANATSSYATRISGVESNVSTLTSNTSAWIRQTEQTITTANLASSQRITDLAASVTTLTSNTSAWIHTTEQALVTANSAIASRIDSLYASITTGNVTTSAGILDFAEAVANATSSYATQISGVTSTVGNLTSNVSTLSSSVNGISSQYGVTLNAGGHIAGFQILSGVTGPSEFIINADTFKIFTDGGSKNPFTVTGAGVALTGNVAIDGNLVVAGTIFTEAIATDAITINKIAPGASLPDYVRTYKGPGPGPGIPLTYWLPLELDAAALNNHCGAVDTDSVRINLQAGTYFYELSVPVKSAGSDTNDSCYTAIIKNPTGVANTGAYVTDTIYGYKGDPGTSVTYWVPDPIVYEVLSTAGVNTVGDWQTATIFGVGRFTLATASDISAAITTTDGSPSMHMVAKDGYCTTIVRIWRDYAV